MLSAEIRTRFLKFFEKNGHAIRASSSLVPADDPTLLFTNAGMVQFKRVFLGMDAPPDGNRRATTSQKCVRAGGKHNDLEQVGRTARHLTFFEMLGNFSFGDYFKSDAIKFAWEFVTGDPAKGNLGIPKEHVRVSVFHEDDEARQLWKKHAQIPDSRIYGLSAKDNFWQMADTGPCGPCTELYVDMAYLTKDFAFPKDATGEWTRTDISEFSLDAFVEGAERDRFVEVWNLVFMQFDKQPDGTMVPLPKPSVDTGAGLDRLSAVMQGQASAFHSDLFLPLIEKVEEVTGVEYAPGYTLGMKKTPAQGVMVARKSQALRNVDPVSFRVIADHARTTAFLIADGVTPDNAGRGYVLRRILRRGVRHAWLLGRREPTLVHVVEKVIEQMGAVYPALVQRRDTIIDTTKREEESFLRTIVGGLSLFDELAPDQGSTQGSSQVHGTISGDEAFKLYDTFGFPIDLTELMAEERGYKVDIAGFEAAMSAQRERSQTDRKSRQIGIVADELGSTATWASAEGAAQRQKFVGYEVTEVDTRVSAAQGLDGGRVAVILDETPFYAESGGQVSDTGKIIGPGWRVDVDEVRKVDGKIAAVGALTGKVKFGPATAIVHAARRRDIRRNHTATHLLHAALRKTLGDHVHQAGSVVEPDRLRFDFKHHGPMTKEQLAEVEQWVNAGIWQNEIVRTTESKYADAVASGAMALFGEKYGDVVRVVEIATRSVELCGGTHVSNTGEILLFRIQSETGVSAGVRRIVAVSGPRAFAMLRDNEKALEEIADRLKVNVHAAGIGAVQKRVDQIIAENKALEKKLEEARRGGGGGSAIQGIMSGGRSVGGWKVVGGRTDAGALAELQALGDSVREQLPSGVGVLGGVFEEGKATLVFVVGDALRAKGVSAGDLVKGFAAKTGGRGGGKPHLAQMGVDPAKMDSALGEAQEFVAGALAGVS
jgi:alanyl-tRNA synthetase